MQRLSLEISSTKCDYHIYGVFALKIITAQVILVCDGTRDSVVSVDVNIVTQPNSTDLRKASFRQFPSIMCHKMLRPALPDVTTSSTNLLVEVT